MSATPQLDRLLVALKGSGGNFTIRPNIPNSVFRRGVLMSVLRAEIVAGDLGIKHRDADGIFQLVPVLKVIPLRG